MNRLMMVDDEENVLRALRRVPATIRAQRVKSAAS